MSYTTFFNVILTFFASLLTGLVPFHHVITASGRDPDVRHSTSYLLSADTNFSCVRMLTLWGFTVTKKNEHNKLLSFENIASN